MLGFGALSTNLYVTRVPESDHDLERLRTTTLQSSMTSMAESPMISWTPAESVEPLFALCVSTRHARAHAHRPNRVRCASTCRDSSAFGKISKQLVAVLVLHPWSPVAMCSAEQVTRLQAQHELDFAHVIFVNGDEAPDAWQVRATPALFLFHNGRRLTFRRPDFDDDVQFCGQLSQAALLELLQFAREAGAHGLTVVRCSE